LHFYCSFSSDIIAVIGLIIKESKNFFLFLMEEKE